MKNSKQTLTFLLLFISFNVFSQESFFFEHKNHGEKLKRGLKRNKALLWSDKKVYKVGEKITITIEWNNGDIIKNDFFKKVAHLKLIAIDTSETYIGGKKLNSITYIFVAQKAGKIKIPSYYFNVDLERYKSNQLKIRIKE